MIKDINANELKQWLDKEDKPYILDVRNDDELLKAKLDNTYTHHIPLNDLLDRIDEIPHNKPIVCMCHHGMRSAKAAYFLEQKGYTDIYNLEGGIHAISMIDASIPKY